MLVAGVIGAAVTIPAGRIIFRLSGAYRNENWVLAEVFRLLFAQARSLGGGTGASLPASVTNDAWSVTTIAALEHLRASAARDEPRLLARGAPRRRNDRACLLGAAQPAGPRPCGDP